jgi:5-methylcytosine-specific restriction endonuclease McrA
LPAAAFHTCRRARTGLQSNCKACARAATTAWWAAKGRPAQRAYHRAWRAEHPGSSRAASRGHYRRNRVREIARVLGWRRENLDWVKAYNRRWLKQSGKNREYIRRYTARKRGATVLPVGEADLRAKVLYWGNRCWVCRGPAQAIDHVKPLTKGGAHVLANLRPICTSCNSRKRNRWPFVPPLP